LKQKKQTNNIMKYYYLHIHRINNLNNHNFNKVKNLEIIGQHQLISENFLEVDQI